jgi:quinoprotein glucose dehydrogenase
MSGSAARSGFGMGLLVLSGLVAFGIAVFNYFWTGNGIHGTAGALLVAISSALMFLAAGAIAIWPAMARWLRGLLLFLILLDIAGTGVAGYMLEAYWLVGATAAALVFWVVHLAADPSPRLATRTAT